MARSTKIYLVYPTTPIFATTESIRADRYVDSFMPQAAFTVKHEAISYIQREIESLMKIQPNSKISFRLYSGPDGSAGGWTEIKYTLV